MSRIAWTSSVSPRTSAMPPVAATPVGNAHPVPMKSVMLTLPDFACRAPRIGSVELDLLARDLDHRLRRDLDLLGGELQLGAAVDGDRAARAGLDRDRAAGPAGDLDGPGRRGRLAGDLQGAGGLVDRDAHLLVAGLQRERRLDRRSGAQRRRQLVVEDQPVARTADETAP